jgi:hypothetical protein
MRSPPTSAAGEWRACWAAASPCCLASSTASTRRSESHTGLRTGVALAIQQCQSAGCSIRALQLLLNLNLNRNLSLPPSWSPETDKHLAVNYSLKDLKAGKAANKAALQKELGLPVDPDVPMLVGLGALVGWWPSSGGGGRWPALTRPLRPPAPRQPDANPSRSTLPNRPSSAASTSRRAPTCCWRWRPG